MILYKIGYFPLNSITLILVVPMKSKDFQNLVLSKHQDGDGPAKMFRDLNDSVSFRTIERWCKAVRVTGSINLSDLPGRQRIIRTKETIQRIKHRLERREAVSSRKTACHLSISRICVRRVPRNDLGLRVYRAQNEPLLTIEHKEKRAQFANWIRTNFQRENAIPMRRCSTLMEFIILKMIKYGWLIV